MLVQEEPALVARVLTVIEIILSFNYNWNNIYLEYLHYWNLVNHREETDLIFKIILSTRDYDLDKGVRGGGGETQDD